MQLTILSISQTETSMILGVLVIAIAGLLYAGFLTRQILAEPKGSPKMQQVWNYIRENNLPYNKLHDQGYPSIGCAPCTRAVKPGEDIRAGRWWWENPETKECGLHVHREELTAAKS